MLAEEINENNYLKNNNNTDEHLDILINILKVVFPESNAYFVEDNSINIPELINSNLLDKTSINDDFKKVIKTAVHYTYSNKKKIILIIIRMVILIMVYYTLLKMILLF